MKKNLTRYVAAIMLLGCTLQLQAKEKPTQQSELSSVAGKSEDNVSYSIVSLTGTESANQSEEKTIQELLLQTPALQDKGRLVTLRSRDINAVYPSQVILALAYDRNVTPLK